MLRARELVAMRPPRTLAERTNCILGAYRAAACHDKAKSLKARDRYSVLEEHFDEHGNCLDLQRLHGLLVELTMEMAQSSLHDITNDPDMDDNRKKQKSQCPAKLA